jgi:5-formyltetrahydrofolate cyclo-ligase
MRQLREALSPERHAGLSRLLCRRLEALFFLLGLRRVAVYAAVRGEADLSGLWEPGSGRRYFFPRVAGKDLVFHEVERPSRDLRAGEFGIPAPDPGTPAAPAGSMDVILAPGLAFDPSGCRIGWGGGFYDRWVASAGEGALLVGVGFAFQLVRDELLPWSPADRRMDWVVTDREAVRCLPCRYAPGGEE